MTRASAVGALSSSCPYAIDPVCGMQVEKSNAPAQSSAGGRRYWFCSDHCCERLDHDPSRFAASSPAGRS